ncbi:uncharacterized protein [Henckelia pumila]|uniref:uncharacterized protein n=1 Tax=Henckelia pumila TaxID=405737 RepID=UPI003C6E582F
MMGLGRGGNGTGGNSSSSTSNLSASAPPFTVDRSNPNHNSNPLVHYPESSYGTEPFSHTWKYTNSISHKPELDTLSTRTTSFPLSDAMSMSPSPIHWTTFSRDAKTLGNTVAYGGEVKSYYPPSVPPMVDESSPLVEDRTAYAHSVIDQDYRPEWMQRLEFNQFTSGQQSKRVDDGYFSSGREKIGDMSAQIDYTHCAIDRDYMPQQMDSLDINGIQYKRVELDGSCSSRVENVGDTSSQFSYTHNAYDWDRPQQMDSLSINGKLYKRAELDGNFLSERAEIGGSHIKTNPANEGCGTEFGDKSGEICGRSNWVTDRAVGIQTVECVNNKLCFEQNPSFAVSVSTYPESHPLSRSHEMHKNFHNYKNSCSRHDKRVRPDDSAFTSSISARRSSPVVIMPPPAIPDILGQRVDSRKPADNGNIAGVCNVHFDLSNPSGNKDPGPKPSSEIKECSLDPKFSNQCNDKGFLSSSAPNEFSTSLQINDTFEGNIEERFGSHILDPNFSLGLAIADNSAQVVNSVENSSDFIDHYNLVVDSPCWKGAPSSQFSAFDVEAGSSHNFIGKLNENFGSDEHKDFRFRSVDDPTRAFPAKAGQNNENVENIFVKNSVVLPLGSILDANYQSKEQILSDDANAEDFMVSTLRSSNGVQTGDALEIPRLNFDFPENLNCGSQAENPDLKHVSGKDEDGMNLNDASEAESSGVVAFHVAEKVLASPSSQEDVVEYVEVQPDSKIRTMIKTMHYLSEMLLSHLSYDSCALEEEDILALNHTVSNLDTCMSSKIARPRNKREPSDPQGYISKNVGEYHDMSTVDYKKGHAKDDERLEKSPVFSFLRDDTDLPRDDGMTKSIKKVLEENFLSNEEMDSQAILFKSLWLEAEATLCSISYKARFDRLKLELGQAKPKSSKDVAATMQKVHISPAPSTSSKLTLESQDSMFPKLTTQGPKASVSITVQDDKNDPVMSRFDILKSREDNLKSLDMKNEQQSKTIVGENHGLSIA